MTDVPAPVTACAGCGALAPEGAVPATWTFQLSADRRDQRGATYLCEACARQNIRSIEGRLDDAWW